MPEQLPHDPRQHNNAIKILYQAAMARLQRREYSPQELRSSLQLMLDNRQQRLHRGTVRPSALDPILACNAPLQQHLISAAVTRCQQQGFCDEQRYSEMQIRRLRRKGRSEFYIRGYLQQHGVTDVSETELHAADAQIMSAHDAHPLAEVAENSQDQALNPETQAALISLQRLLRNQQGQRNRLPLAKLKLRTWQSLQRQGFSTATIDQAWRLIKPQIPINKGEGC